MLESEYFPYIVSVYAIAVVVMLSLFIISRKGLKKAQREFKELKKKK